jgi:hypothetical protein
MTAFEDGQRVRYIGMRGPGVEWYGREGVVKETYRRYGGNRVLVLLDGEEMAWSFDEGSLEPAKATYIIENWAEDSTSAELELTEPEAALIERVVEALNDTNVAYAPTLTFERKKNK